MAFTSTILKRDATAKSRVHTGTFASTGSGVGGDIETGLEKVTHMTFTCEAAAVGNSPVVDETLPCDGNAVSIVTDADESGTWMAWGR